MQLTNMWVAGSIDTAGTSSTGITGMLMDKVIEDISRDRLSNSTNDNSELLSTYPLVNIQDIHSAATSAKRAWDAMMYDLARRMKIESRRNEDGWGWFHDKLSKIETQSLDSSYDYNYATPEGLITMPIKDKDVALKKASRDYHMYTIDSKGGPPICHVTDWVRCSIVCSSDEKMCNIISALKVNTNMRVIHIRNRFVQPTPAGYRDILVKVAISVESESDKRRKAVGFICELQLHHLMMFKASVREDLYYYYKYFYSYFKDCFHDPKVIAERVKVLKKMDQISNDARELDNFIVAFLTGNSRASRDISRLHSLFSILKLVGETDLAETVQMSIIQQYRAKNMRKELSGALSKLSAHLKGRHKYQQALPLSEEALRICEDDHGFLFIDTAVQNMNLGTLCSCLGDYARALSHFETANKIYTDLVGPNNVRTLEALHFIAVVHQDVQNWSMASDHFNELLNRKLEVYGFYNLEVAEAIRSIAFIDEVRDSLAAAIQMHEAALNIYQRIYGEHHQSVAEAYISIALLYDRQGRLFDALGFHNRALAIRQRVLPPDHEAIAESLNGIGLIYVDIGQGHKALPLLESALDIRMKVFASNPKHVLIAESKNNLGDAFLHTNNSMECLERAKVLLEEAYAVRVKIFGLNHVCTQQTLNSQSLVYELLAYEKGTSGGHGTNPESDNKCVSSNSDNSNNNSGGGGGVSATDASLLERKGVSDMLSGQQLDEALKEASGYLHDIPDHQDKGEYFDALRLCHRALSVIRNSRQNGVNQLAYAIALNGLGVIYEDEEQHKHAEVIFSHTLRILFYCYGDIPHSNIAIALSNLGNAFRFQGKYTAALTTFQRSKEMWTLLGKDGLSREINSVDYSIAQCNLCLRNFNDANNIAVEVLKNRNTVYGADSVESSTVHNLMGIIHAADGRLEDALRSFEDAGKIRDALLGRQHMSSATVSGNMSLVYILLQDLAKAGVVLSQSLEIRDRQSGPANRDVELALLNYSAVFKVQNNREVASALENGIRVIRSSSRQQRARGSLRTPLPSPCACHLCWDDDILKY